MSVSNETEIRRDSAAIVGFTASRLHAPWEDDEWEIWAMNGLYEYGDIARATRWFDLHDRTVIAEKRLAWYRDECARLAIPIYMQQAWPDVPTSQQFPARELVEQFGPYFTNSVSWMAAYAAYAGYRRLAIYGIDMATDSEFRFQRPNLEYIIGRVMGLGCEVTVARTSDLLKATHLYGYQEDSGLRGKLKERHAYFQTSIQQIDAKLNEHQRQVNELVATKQQMIGNRDNCAWLLQSWGVLGPDSQDTRHPEEGRVEVPVVRGNAPGSSGPYETTTTELALVGASEE